MIKELAADGEELVGCLYPSDGVLELGDVSLDDVDEVALHLLHVLRFDKIAVLAAGFFVEHRDVVEDHAATYHGNIFS